MAPVAVSSRIGLASAMLLLAPMTQQALAQSAARPAQAPPAAETPAGSVGGMGDVNLYPKRVVIDSKQRVASVGLFNRAAAQGEYEISVTDMMMTPEGRLVELGTVDRYCGARQSQDSEPFSAVVAAPGDAGQP